MSRPRVLLVDDHTLVLDGFRKLLEDRVRSLGWRRMGVRCFEWPRNLSPTS